LAIDYCRRPVPTLAAGYPYWTWLLPAVLSWALWRARAGALWVAAAVLVIGVLPVLGLVRFRFQATSTVADRYLYLAMLGPAIAICHVMQRARLPGIISFIIIIALLAVRSFFAVGVWHDSIALYRNAIAVHPESVVAHNNLGSVLEMHGDRQGAIAQWRIALALQPDLSEARDNLRDALSR
jgi:tetratricopeptide (TPR) repeat protein